MPLGGFDVIFCRNVLLYFDQKAKTGILERISKLLPPDGLLYLGGAETVPGVSDKFQPLAGHRGIYALTGQSGLGSSGDHGRLQGCPHPVDLPFLSSLRQPICPQAKRLIGLRL